MGTLVNRNGKFRAVIRVKGLKPITKTFDRAGDAKDWMKDTEAGLKHRVICGGGMTFGQLLTRYRVEVVETRKHVQLAAVRHYKRHAINFDKVDLSTMTYQWWVDTIRGFKRTNGKPLSPASTGRYVTEFRSALTTATDLWAVTFDWEAFKKACAACSRQNLTSPSTARERRVKDAEIAILKKAIRRPPLPMGDIIDFALATAMRREEIVKLKWEDLDDNKAAPMIWVRDRKGPKKNKGVVYTDHVPLLGAALAIIKRQPRTPGEPLIFPYDKELISTNFGTIRNRTALKDLHFHDLRHEAVSRLFELGYGIPEVALISGHRDWDTLRKYTHLNPASLHAGPLAHRRAA